MTSGMSGKNCDLEVPESETEDLSRLEEWTPEQQLKALKHRISAVISMPLSPSDFVAHPSDVIVAVPPKCGTTWILHICHQLRMQGAEPNFEEQWHVIPWLEQSMVRLQVEGPHTEVQPAHPRIFKSHLPYSLVPKSGKLIYCYRDGKDSMLSSYKFLDSKLILRGRVSLPIFTKFTIEERGAVDKTLQSLLDWWEHRHDDNVLILFYDDLKEDHVGCVRRIAKFVEIECSESVIERVVHTTTHAEMARHHSKFSNSSVNDKLAQNFGEKLSFDVVETVRRDGGRSGDGQKLLPQEAQDYIDRKWNEVITTRLGFKDLNEMRKAWQEEQ